MEDIKNILITEYNYDKEEAEKEMLKLKDSEKYKGRVVNFFRDNSCYHNRNLAVVFMDNTTKRFY